MNGLTYVIDTRNKEEQAEVAAFLGSKDLNQVSVISGARYIFVYMLRSNEALRIALEELLRLCQIRFVGSEEDGEEEEDQ